MGVGAVAHVLEDVLFIGEGRHADPLRALRAHMGAHHDIAAHPHRHGVAADAGGNNSAVGRDGRGIMRAARAIPGGARGGRDFSARANRVEFRQPGVGRLHAPLARQALRQGAGDDVGFELTVMRQEFLLLLVELADDARRIGHAVEHVLGEHFQERPLLLDDEDFLQAAREIADDRGLHRKQHAHLQDADAVACSAASSRPSSRNACLRS